MNVGMPPRSRNHRLPAACDTPTAIAASSLVNPLAISCQNDRSTPRRSDGAPGDFIADLPVNAFIHPAGLPIDTSTIKVLQRPVESAQYTSAQFGALADEHGVRLSVGHKGQCWDNAVAESFFATIKAELIDRRGWPTRVAVHRAIFSYIEGWYNTRRLHSSLSYLSPNTYETTHRVA
ncbi:integrase core domain-containing protein [Amycolatopsis mediterranei]|uniref:integrase core domain-containing protein n=1 Tax=Amycolatopsis mediterranei TaxID=33910 RepID=UPI00343B0959